MRKMVLSKRQRGDLEMDKLEALAVELKLMRWSCRSVHGWMGAAAKQSRERCEKFLGNSDLYTRCFGVGWRDAVC